MRRALITGVTGQDGSYLAELLLSKGYEVFGLARRVSSGNTAYIDHLLGGSQPFHLVIGDLTDGSALSRTLRQVQPHEIYNLAAQSHVRVSFDLPEHTSNVGALGAVRLLEAVRDSACNARIYQAASSEMFGSSPPPQSEQTPLRPRSPYAAAKVFALHIAQNYREAYGLHISNGILFNHESPRRSDQFVTRKITRAAARIKLGRQQKLCLGNLEARRDWGFAGDYVQAMWAMLQQDKPDDFVIATGESHSVRDFLDVAFGRLQLDWRRYVELDPRYLRPTEVEALCGDASKARSALAWSPQVRFHELVELMVDSDLRSESTLTTGL